MSTSPIHFSDFYKTDHARQAPDGTTGIYANMTPRGSRIEGIDKVVVFGFQYFVLEYLIKRFNRDFFEQPKDLAVRRYKRRLDNALGKDAVEVSRWEKLHDLGYLPLHIKALNEGLLCPMRVPALTIRETHPDFYWLPTWMETLLSTVTWHPMTSATIAHQYRVLIDAYAVETSDIPNFADWQGHDFSMRGHTSVESSCVSGMAHLLSFTGTDTIPAIDFLEEYYFANSDEELVGGSVPATEHSVMCLGSKETEFETYKRLISKVYPKGFISIVSDTWDYWKILTEVLPALKAEIMARDGRVVIRPDSGDPVKIICGDPDAPKGSPAHKGTIELLYEAFGGEKNSKGYIQLDTHIGAIYGDSITLQRAKEILEGLKSKGFASTNIVFGIGSFTYQYVTRDTFGFAVKATSGIINGERVAIFKDPKTDSGLKRSAKGLLRVNADFSLSEDVTEDEEKEGLLETIFDNGVAYNLQTLTEIRKRLAEQL
jgi:nicotinamide phosphoribosyltransferase